MLAQVILTFPATTFHFEIQSNAFNPLESRGIHRSNPIEAYISN